LLDTGEGKSFLAEKLRIYQDVINNASPESLTPKAQEIKERGKSETENIDLANQEILRELESGMIKGSSANKLIAADEDFFISDEGKSLRRSVDIGGARIIRFGASENPLKLQENIYRIQSKDEAIQRIESDSRDQKVREITTTQSKATE
jgi:hypothetical protein